MGNIILGFVIGIAIPVVPVLVCALLDGDNRLADLFWRTVNR